MVHFLQGTEIGGVRLSTELVTKRIVILHRTGPLAGVHQIAGDLRGNPEDIARELLPTYWYDKAGEQKRFDHYRTDQRLVEYREVS